VHAEEAGGLGGAKVLNLNGGDDALPQRLLGLWRQRSSIGWFHPVRVAALLLISCGG
jgi:hypothetical protein